MKFWHIAWKDLKIQFKDTGAMVLLFVVPIVVITIASFALSGMFGGGTKAIRVPVVDLDRSDFSRHVLEDLKEINALAIEETVIDSGTMEPITEKHARNSIETGKRAVAIVIPPGFGERVKTGQPTEFILLQNPGEQISTSTVHGIVDGIATRITAKAVAVQAALQAVGKNGRTDIKEITPAVLGAADRLWQTPAVQVRGRDVAAMADKKVDPFKQNVPGYAVMFALFSMLAGGSALLKERELGTFRRLLSAPVGKASILAGKLIPNFITALLQIIVFFAFGHFVFGMELGNSLLGLAVMAGAVALAATSMGIFMAALAKTEAQLSSLSVLIILMMSSLGGSWWPLEIVPDFMRNLAHVVTVNAWAMDGFKDLLWYGRGAVDVLPEAGVLLVMASAAFGIGLWRFKFD